MTLIPDLSGHNCVITGATSGIGRSTACALGAMRANLILVGRNRTRGHRVERLLRDRSPQSRIEFLAADLSRQREVRALAAAVGQRFDRVDVLINNAGARNDRYTATDDGLELTFATNHLAHFLLTTLLLDRLERAPAARVVTLSSGAHVSAPGVATWCLPPSQYNRRRAYAQSKLANVLFAFELARRLENTRVTSNSVDPGGVATRFARNNGFVRWIRHLVAHAVRRDLVSSRMGAETVIYLASSPDVVRVTGKHFRDKREIAASPAAHDRQAARDLWNLSEQLTRFSEPESRHIAATLGGVAVPVS